MKTNIKRGDQVYVLTGKDKKAEGKVIAVDPDSGFAKVEGVNMATKHSKGRKQGETSKIEKIEGNIHISNLQVICPACGKHVRTNRTEVDGKTVRTCIKCKANIEVKRASAAKKTAKKGAKADEAAAKPEKKGAKKAETAKKTVKKEKSE